MSESLQNILSYAETLNMPDGDYLRVANSLKHAFKQISPKWITFGTENMNDICIILENGLSTISVKNYVKSISVSNVKEPGPIKYKIDFHSEIIDTNEPSKNKTFEFSVEPNGGRLCKLYTLFEIIEPTKVYMRFEEIETTYNCFDYLKEIKHRAKLENNINSCDDSDDDIHLCVDNFIHIIRNKFIHLCESWGMSKYYENKLD